MNYIKPEDLTDIGAAAELLLEAMAKASGHVGDLPPHMWYQLKLNLFRRQDGTLVIQGPSLSISHW